MSWPCGKWNVKIDQPGKTGRPPFIARLVALARLLAIILVFVFSYNKYFVFCAVRLNMRLSLFYGQKLMQFHESHQILCWVIIWQWKWRKWLSGWFNLVSFSVLFSLFHTFHLSMLRFAYRHFFLRRHSSHFFSLWSFFFSSLVYNKLIAVLKLHSTYMFFDRLNAAIILMWQNIFDANFSTKHQNLIIFAKVLHEKSARALSFFR